MDVCFVVNSYIIPKEFEPQWGLVISKCEMKVGRKTLYHEVWRLQEEHAHTHKTRFKNKRGRPLMLSYGPSFCFFFSLQHMCLPASIQLSCYWHCQPSLELDWLSLQVTIQKEKGALPTSPHGLCFVVGNSSFHCHYHLAKEKHCSSNKKKKRKMKRRRRII